MTSYKIWYETCFCDTFPDARGYTVVTAASEEEAMEKFYWLYPKACIECICPIKSEVVRA